MKNVTILFITVLMFSSCDRNMYVNLQANKLNTGQLIIKPSMTTERTYITLNDSLIVNNKVVKSLILSGLEPGQYTLNYTSGNKTYKSQLNKEIDIKIEAGKTITKIVEVPPHSNGYWIYQAASILVMGTIFTTFPLRVIRYR